MKKAQIVHNPSSGDGSHTKEEVVAQVENNGFKAAYVSTKDDASWQKFQFGEMENIFVAGGDGTVTKIMEKLLSEVPDQKILLHVLPHGTANNIAKTLQTTTIIEQHSIKDEKKTKNFDCGVIEGGPTKFFFESLGIGVFPELITLMKQINTSDNPSKKLKRSLDELIGILQNFEAIETSIEVDGLTLEGSFILIELMNIKYLGPNLHLAPNADPGDGYFELVLITEEKRAEFLHYLKALSNGSKSKNNIETFAKTIRVQALKMKCINIKIHIDDTVVDTCSNDTLEIKIRQNCLQFSKIPFE
ncbi:diacylglycerol/lipid kinase family protein [Maribacter litoralis]|uniref:diacylglycerol/lipid kinase family protein n=1 Tax=Maribacter litoralis TaxID=2059726 RepID=UPI000E31FD4E|nr:diacylglycerol kinase family protein [Maribacter litoralis]